MGCTSSAPTTLSANASKQDKNIQFEDAEKTFSKHVEVIDTESENRTEMKELPPSDTTESVLLVRNNKSTTNLEPNKDLDASEHTILEKESSNTSSNTSKEAQNEERDEKISKLKLEVVEKFISTNQDTNHDRDVIHLYTDEAAEFTEKDIEETDVKAETEVNFIGKEHNNNSEESDQASPSQSQSSRATRWEALADIAAELPPSLAVDPITGQIYSLSK